MLATPAGDVALRHVDVRAEVTGDIANVEVAQWFENSFEAPIEAIYVFPLPEDAAVREMEMHIGDRVVRADLREREAAREAYDAARALGQATSLLEQERPNIFTMNVANIPPGEQIVVVTRYVDQLDYADGRYQFAHPTTVGPRFIPGTPAGHDGTGHAQDTARVPDASRITPQLIPPGTAVPYDVTFELEVASSIPLQDFASASHEFEVAWESAPCGSSDCTVLSAQLPQEERRPDRDIAFSFALAGDEPLVGVQSSWAAQGGFFTLTVEPPATIDEDDVRPKEMVFVLDVSGSMSGAPLDASKQAIRHALSHLNPDDTFRIMRFSDSASGLSSRPLRNTPENIRRGLSYVDSLTGSGGTHMRAGIEAALSPRPDDDRLRVVWFLTDGYIGNEAEIFGLIERQIGQARLFSLGVGSSVNRHLLEGMADVGRGDAFFVDHDQSSASVVEAFYRRVQNPVFTEVELDWEGVEVHSITPSRIADVFEGTPLVVTGRYDTPGEGSVTVRGWHGSVQREITLPVWFDDRAEGNDSIQTIWARRRLAEVERDHWQDPSGGDRDVLALALEFGIASRLTSFVAVDESTSGEAAVQTVAVPSALPAGVSANAFGNSAGMGMGMVGSGRGGGGSGHSMGTGGMLHSLGSRDLSALRLGASTRGSEPRARVRLGNPVVDAHSATVTGSLDRSIIQRVMRRNSRQIRDCYQRALQTDPTLAGRLVYDIHIDEEGHVTAVTLVEDAIGSATMAECVERRLRRMRFPESESAFTVGYPFSFTLEE